MGKFKAQMELPRFVSKEEILGKEVYDADLLYMGTAKDCAWASDGIIRMILKDDDNKIAIIVPFHHIKEVGAYIKLKVSQTKFIKDNEDIARAAELFRLLETEERKDKGCTIDKIINDAT